jgi:hypothetical protein
MFSVPLATREAGLCGARLLVWFDLWFCLRQPADQIRRRRRRPRAAARSRTLNIEHSTSNFERILRAMERTVIVKKCVTAGTDPKEVKSKTGLFLHFDVQCWAFDVRCSRNARRIRSGLPAVASGEGGRRRRRPRAPSAPRSAAEGSGIV